MSITGTEKTLGLTMIPDGKSNICYGVLMQYAAASTTEDVILEAVSNYKDKRTVSEIHIKKINPKRATMLEMFALCSYADDAGISEKGATGSFGQLRRYAYNAAVNGKCREIDSFKSFCRLKLDWDSMLNSMKDIYLEAAVYNQYQQCLKFMDMFDHFYEKLNCINS